MVHFKELAEIALHIQLLSIRHSAYHQIAKLMK